MPIQLKNLDLSNVTLDKQYEKLLKKMTNAYLLLEI